MCSSKFSVYLDYLKRHVHSPPPPPHPLYMQLQVIAVKFYYNLVMGYLRQLSM